MSNDFMALCWYFSLLVAFILGRWCGKWEAASLVQFLADANARLRKERDETPEAEPVEDYDDESAPWHNNPDWWKEDR